MKKLLLIALGAFLLIGCRSSQPKEEVKDDSKEEEKKEDVNMETNPVATIVFKDLGEMKFELMVNEAPQSVFNFTELANSGFYDGLTMHRVIKDFVAQGGDPQGTGTGGPGHSIKGEFKGNGVDNKTGHSLGAIAFARSQHPDSAGSQFYIVLSEFAQNQRDYMDNDYAAFGVLLEGQDVLEKINTDYATQDQSGVPLQDLIIESVTVDTKGQELPAPEKLK